MSTYSINIQDNAEEIVEKLKTARPGSILILDIEKAIDQNEATAHTAVVEQVEQVLIEIALQKTHGNQTKACKLIGMCRSTLRSRVNQYNQSRKAR